MKGWCQAFVLLVMGLLFGCQSEEPAPQSLGEAVQTVVDALDVQAKSVAQVDSLLGEPTDTSLVKGPESIMPGQVRQYESDRTKVTVQFYKGSASQLVVEYAASDTSSMENRAVDALDVREALRVIGLDEETLEPAWAGPLLWKAPRLGIRRVAFLPGTKVQRAVAVWYEGFPEALY